jgi:hypothetical protein
MIARLDSPTKKMKPLEKTLTRFSIKITLLHACSLPLSDLSFQKAKNI